eukprot:TRINITY_DN3391_c0_g1_i2.p1 TRINITY_DN3391_c0_g1~~TRINITY_DN3391_c0_g1_i2.p1  ORF type:complete len:104 (+),score=33.90 TRINITY_DN3391_c0_g1_i2:127-438(+)
MPSLKASIVGALTALLMANSAVDARFLRMMSHRVANDTNASNATVPPGQPEQGYSGEHVQHEDRKTWVGDWGSEGGWTKKDEEDSKVALKASKKAWRDYHLGK